MSSPKIAIKALEKISSFNGEIPIEALEFFFFLFTGVVIRIILLESVFSDSFSLNILSSSLSLKDTLLLEFE